MILTDFLLARIADDEEWAKAATPGPWGDPEEDFGYGEFGWYVHGCPAGETNDSEQGRADIKFIARNHPARVLAECDAKRRIVEDFQYLDTDYHKTHSEFTEARRFQALVSLGHLAAAHADHPDYREEWKP